jgi:hypothetical protein
MVVLLVHRCAGICNRKGVKKAADVQLSKKLVDVGSAATVGIAAKIWGVSGPNRGYLACRQDKSKGVMRANNLHSRTRSLWVLDVLQHGL